ncbi:serine/threonine protein kinase [Rhodococcus sp. CX]|uniref:serine/threonine protein kinase n=1 Tax=Rhodococcus sp. CX TaxID=2789880 RepID=UPI0018CC7EDE|nr:serine/threonine-protein kinase [Rhodococcus sp. CX]MBH0118423.1 serine/threonine protein kinase [Rhodococcus sp. CX]
MNSLVVLVAGCALALIVVGVVLRIRAKRRLRRFSAAVPQPQRLWTGPVHLDDSEYDRADGARVDHAFPEASSPRPLRVDADGFRFHPYEISDIDTDHTDDGNIELGVSSDGPVILAKGANNAWRSRLRKPDRQDEIRYYDDGSLRRGRELGSGGQGAVYELIERDGEVEKRFFMPLEKGAREFEELLRRRTAVEAAVSACPIHLCWPENPVRREETLMGYVMPRIPDRFFFEVKFGRSGVKRRERELQHAIPRKSAMALPFDVTDEERFELVYLVARFLDAMHRNNLVYGDISWVNFIFSLNPVELCVLDFDSSRVQGSLPFTRMRPVDTPDWEDPEWPDSVVTRMDSDRYKFALLAYRMLIARSLDGLISDDFDVPALSGADPEQLSNLWSRARGPAGTRPQIAEWLNAFESVRV